MNAKKISKAKDEKYIFKKDGHFPSSLFSSAPGKTEIALVIESIDMQKPQYDNFAKT